MLNTRMFKNYVIWTFVHDGWRIPIAPAASWQKVFARIQSTEVSMYQANSTRHQTHCIWFVWQCPCLAWLGIVDGRLPVWGSFKAIYWCRYCTSRWTMLLREIPRSFALHRPFFSSNALTNLIHTKKRNCIVAVSERTKHYILFDGALHFTLFTVA